MADRIRDWLQRIASEAAYSGMNQLRADAEEAVRRLDSRDWLLARWEEMYDVLGLESHVRHPVDATEQVRIMRDDLTVADRRARRWEAKARDLYQRLGIAQYNSRVSDIERDTARRELGEVRRLVEEHRRRRAASLIGQWSTYGDGACDALDELSAEIDDALGKEQGNEH